MAITKKIGKTEYRITVDSEGTFREGEITGEYATTLAELVEKLKKREVKRITPKAEIVVQHKGNKKIGTVVGKTDAGFKVRWHNGGCSYIVANNLRRPMSPADEKVLEDLRTEARRLEDESDRISRDAYDKEQEADEMADQFEVADLLYDTWRV